MRDLDIVNDINLKLSVIPWIDLRFGRVYHYPVVSDRSITRVPGVYAGDQIIPFISFDGNSGVTGIHLGPESISEYDFGSANSKRVRDIGIILICNMDRVAGNSSDESRSLAREVVEAELVKVYGLELTGFIDDDTSEVFKEFDIKDFSADVALFPYCYFRWNGKIAYNYC